MSEYGDHNRAWGVRFAPRYANYRYLLLRRPLGATANDVAQEIVDAIHHSDNTRTVAPWLLKVDEFSLIEFGGDPNQRWWPPSEGSFLDRLQPVASLMQPASAVTRWRIEVDVTPVYKAERVR